MSGQRSDWRERLHANPSRMEQELAINLEHDQIHYLTQVEIPITTADFYFPVEPRPFRRKTARFRRRNGLSNNGFSLRLSSTITPIHPPRNPIPTTRISTITRCG